MSDARKSAPCPACGAEAERIISRDPGEQNPSPPALVLSRSDSKAGSLGSEATTVSQPIDMVPTHDVERGAGAQSAPSEESRRGNQDPWRLAGSAAVITPTATGGETADKPEVGLEKDTVPLEMPWLTESQPGGGNLWYIRDWGIASMFGYLRKGAAVGISGEPSLPAAAADADLADSDRYGPTPGEDGPARGRPDLATRPADSVDGYPTFSEWRAAVSIMPWLLETSVESSEAVSESPDVINEDADMPRLRPRRNRAAVHLAWAGWLKSRPEGEQAADAIRPRSRPTKEGVGEDFPDQVIETAWRRQGGRCAGCGRWLIWSHRDRDSGIGAWESHYRAPLDRGGSHLLANCVLFCSSVADCHFNVGHAGIGWHHYAPLDEPGLLFLFAGSAAATAPASPVRPRRSLLRDVLGIPQVGRDRGSPGEGAGERGSTG